MYGRVLVLFGLMATGYVFSKKNILTDGAMSNMNTFVIYFAYPCLLVNNVNGMDAGKSLFGDFLLIIIIAPIIMYLGYGFAYLWGRITKADSKSLNVWSFSASSSNNGFMGFPIALMFFGEEGLFFMLANSAALNLYFFTLGIYMLKRGKKKREHSGINKKEVFHSIKELALNPNIIALVVGLITVTIGFKFPDEMSIYFDYMGDIATPMAMIYIGTTLAKSDVFKIVRSFTHWSNAFFKLVLFPLITYLLVVFLPINPAIKISMVLSSCFPVAATVSMLAEQEGQDTKLAGELLFISTVISVLTLPISISLVQGIK